LAALHDHHEAEQQLCQVGRVQDSFEESHPASTHGHVPGSLQFGESLDGPDNLPPRRGEIGEGFFSPHRETIEGPERY
jgi:hypothetical protein